MTPATTQSANSLDATSLDRLHDIIVPSRAPWWPPAPGWFILAAIVALALALAAAFFIYRYRRNLYRRQALAELYRLEESDAHAGALIAMAVLLKRVALTAYPRAQVASLIGKPWIDWLNQTGGRFSTRAGQLLNAAPYDETQAMHASDTELHELRSAARAWIAHHRERKPC